MDGRSLAEDVSAYGRLSPAAAALVARDLLAALASLHAAGQAHGNVTADTVRLTGTGEAVLTGFAGGATPADDLRALGETLRAAVEVGGLEPLISRLVSDPPTATEALALLPQPEAPETPVEAPPAKPAGNREVVGPLLAVLGIVLVIVIIAANARTAGNSSSASDTTTNEYVTDTTTTEETTTTAEPTTTTVEPTTTTPTFDPASLDDKATDDTPLTADALLPNGFTDGQRVHYSRRSGDTQNGCGNNWASSQVTDTLTRAGCEQLVTGVYVDDSNQIMVWVAVAPLPTEQAAASAQNALQGTHSGDWGVQCPQTGAGSSVCQASWAQFNDAEQYGYTGHQHRYLIHAVAIYISLGQGTDDQKWVDAASDQAVTAAGPDNYR